MKFSVTDKTPINGTGMHSLASAIVMTNGGKFLRPDNDAVYYNRFCTK